MNKYEYYMEKCIELAKRGRGNTSPNPLVGCIVTDKDGNVLSEGYHHKYGEYHAERDALLKLKKGEEKDGILYVNLEPCSHQGKTPPCADLIIERGIKKVIIGCGDTNPKVNGNGIEKLKAAGIEVICGVLEKECRKLNEVFFTDIEEHRMFVTIKTATTIDGKISTSGGDSKWITSEDSRIYAKKLRTYYDAILTTSATIIADNPKMEHRLKIILDRTLKTDFNKDIYKSGRIMLVTDKKHALKTKTLPKNIEIITCSTENNKFDLKELCEKLYSKGIKSVFVEAGGKLAGSFIKEGLADKIYQFISPKILNDNSGRSCFDGDSTSKISEAKRYNIEDTTRLDTDILIIYSKVE